VGLRQSRGAARASAAITATEYENDVAGSPDQPYERVWDGMSEVERWWAAFSKAVGPAPTFARRRSHSCHSC
jgi:hypothetical protein